MNVCSMIKFAINVLSILIELAKLIAKLAKRAKLVKNKRRPCSKV